jgi:hypothetical protein
LEELPCNRTEAGYLPGDLWPTKYIATVVGAAPREGVIPALEFARNLLICSSAPRHQNNVEAGQAVDRNHQY